MTIHCPLPGKTDLPLARLRHRKFSLRIDPRLVGFTASSPHRAVSIPARFRLPSTRHPSTSVTTPSSSFQVLLLLRVPSLLLLARLTFRSELHLASGSSPSSRLHSRAATFREDSHVLATLRPQVFSTSRRFAPHSSSRAYFIPLPRPGSRPFRGFSPRAATLPHREEPAPMPLVRARLTRLRRLPPLPDLDFEAFIHARPRSPLRSYSPRREPLPSSSFSPPGSHSSPWAPAYPEPSALHVHLGHLRLRVRPQGPSSASTPRGARSSRLRPDLPARGFEPTLRVSGSALPHPTVARPMIPFVPERLRG